MQSKYFLSNLILTLTWCLKSRIRSRWEKFVPSYNPFFYVVQITILATARITRDTIHFTEGHHSLRHNQSREAWVWCGPSTSRRGYKMGGLARNSRRRAKPFLLSHYCSEDNRAYLPDKDRPRKISLSASQWLSRWGIPRPPLRECWQQTCLRTISIQPFQSNLERDCFSASREPWGSGSRLLVKD